MIVNIKDFTAALAKIREIIAGSKAVSGIMFDIRENEFDVCFSDGHKSLITTLECENEEGDVLGKVVLDYKALDNAISNLQPSGRIRVDDIFMTFNNNLIAISAEQKLVLEHEDGTEDVKVMANKKTDVTWVLPTANQKVALLDRMNYKSIFESDLTDEWKAGELIDVLNRLSFEKNRLIYMSPKNHNVWVANTADLAVYPIADKEITVEDEDELRGELAESGESDKFNERLEALKSKMHYGIILTTNNAKALAGVLNKIDSETALFVHLKDGFLNIFTGDEKLGIWMETATGNRMHTGTYTKYSETEFSKYQIDFIREFLVDNIKSTINTTSSENVAFGFEQNEETGEISLVISTASHGSMNNESKVILAGLTDIDHDILSRKLNISLKVFANMLNQLKTDLVAMDLAVKEDGTCFLRLAEIDNMKFAELAGELSEMPDETEDDIAAYMRKKIEKRASTLGVMEYTMLAK